MKPARGRTIAIAGAATMSAAMLLGGLGYRWELRERWYLWKLGSEDQEEREHAAGRLGQLVSVRAVARLLPEERRDILEALDSFEFHIREGRMYAEDSRVVGIHLTQVPLCRGARAFAWPAREGTLLWKPGEAPTAILEATRVLGLAIPPYPVKGACRVAPQENLSEGDTQFSGFGGLGEGIP